MQAVTRSLDDGVDPVAVGARSGLLWSGGGLTLAGVGAVHRWTLERGAAQAVAVQQRLADLSGTNLVGGPGTGPVGFTAMAFDPTEAAELVVPEIVIGSDGQGRCWITVLSDDTDAHRVLSDYASSPAPAPAPASVPSEIEVSAPVSPEAWRDEIVATVRDRIRDGRLNKAVLARELRVRAGAAIDQERVLHHLIDRHPAATIFAVDGFVGASPELLVGRFDDTVRAHPLAGTAPRGDTEANDHESATALLHSSKDRWEHRITIDWLLEELLPFCSYVDAEPEPTIVSLSNVHHLGTRVEGKLSQPGASILELVHALHPTPAVGGDPQDRALALIAELERADRGRYAGPAGWVDGNGNGAFVVAIRSAEITGAEARLFAGVGVVGDSDPASELAETRAKFAAMLPALVGDAVRPDEV